MNYLVGNTHTSHPYLSRLMFLPYRYPPYIIRRLREVDADAALMILEY